jgi:hypothetical protein
MKTNTIRTVVLLIPLVVCTPRAQAFYNPSTGRWLNRDPINERGFGATHGELGARIARTTQHVAMQYHFTMNEPISRFDFLGLSCKNPCEWARRHGEGETGITVCCGGKKYACLIFSGGLVGTPNPKARSIIDACTLAHEQVHVDDPNKRCPEQCLWKHPTYGDWAQPDPATQIAGERAAYLKGIDCLQTSKSQCGGDSACEAAIDAEIVAQQRKLEHDY